MQVGPGTRVGPYEIVSLLGEGGMGRVYLARDTRLGRTVAIKLLPADRASDSTARARFQREARTIANLTHPRICALYDVGSIDGFDYLVMEHLGGETLRARLRRGPLPLEEALERAIETADALQVAHRAGIVHRDLNPANIMLTRSGTKLLDFGIAALLRGAPSTTTEMAPPATTVTAPGSVLGTPEYMSPEQVEGRAADQRTDIFAFGAVLYEMLTGRRPFQGQGFEIALAILRDQPPPVSAAAPSTPVLDRAVARCLAKNPDQRWQTVTDLLAELLWIRELHRQPAAAAATAPDSTLPTRVGHSRTAIAAGFIALLGVGALLLLLWRSTASDLEAEAAPIVRFTVPIEPPTGLDAGWRRFGGALGSRLAISPDGRRMAYVAEDAEGSRVYVRSFESMQSLPLAGTLGASSVFFAPDGEWVGFFSDGKLKKARLSGGAVTTICDAVAGVGASWGADDVIVFAPSPTSALFRVPSDGGTPERVTELIAGETSHRWPDILPGGDAIVFAAAGGSEFTGSRLIIQSLRTGARSKLTEGTYPRYTATGHLLFARDGSLFAVPLNIGSMKLGTRTVSIIEDMSMNSTTGAALFTVSSTGVLLYRPRIDTVARRQLMWVTREGKEELITPDRRAYLQPRLSPDARRLALAVGQVAPERDVWIYDLERNTMDRVTFDAGEDETPVWSPDGKQLGISAARPNRPRSIYTLAIDDAAPRTEIATTNAVTHLAAWSPDGRALLWTDFEVATGGDIKLFTRDRSVPIRALVSGPFDERGPAFSPDGKWLAYTSTETGRSEVFVRPMDGSGGKTRISTDGGTQPVWSPTGGELYYRGPTHVMAVAVATGSDFSGGPPQRLFPDIYEREHRDDRNYDVAGDGRFVMLKSEPGEVGPQLNVVLNWFAELQQRTH